jgi:hypothetical protein
MQRVSRKRKRTKRKKEERKKAAQGQQRFSFPSWTFSSKTSHSVPPGKTT